MEGEYFAATIDSSATALPSPCRSARTGSGMIRQQQLVEPRSPQETVPSDSCGGHLEHRNDRRTTAVLGMGKSPATSAHYFRKHEGGGSSTDGAEGNQAQSRRSSTSGMDSCERSQSETFTRENGPDSTPKSGNGGKTVNLGNRGLDWETLSASNTHICKGDTHTLVISEALAHTEALAR